MSTPALIITYFSLTKWQVLYIICIKLQTIEKTNKHTDNCFQTFYNGIWLQYTQHPEKYHKKQSPLDKTWHYADVASTVLPRVCYCSMRDFRLSCRIVSFTAWKTNLMFSVSIAVVKWWKSGLLRSRRRQSNMFSSKFCTSVNFRGFPRNCVK